uniref:Uncharacterized protein n=1 Tax=Arundo donax TaxID=35708 RepID=A0A0A8YFU1_ARUDO
MCHIVAGACAILPLSFY